MTSFYPQKGKSWNQKKMAYGDTHFDPVGKAFHRHFYSAKRRGIEIRGKKDFKPRFLQ